MAPMTSLWLLEVTFQRWLHGRIEEERKGKTEEEKKRRKNRQINKNGKLVAHAFNSFSVVN